MHDTNEHRSRCASRDFGLEAAAWPLLLGTMKGANAAGYHCVLCRTAPPVLQRVSCSLVSSASTWWPDMPPGSL